MIAGVPLFICLFAIPFLNGSLAVTVNVKIVLEVLIIVAAYTELTEIERENKEQIEKRGILAKILPLAHQNKGAFNEYWATLGKAEEITRELGVEELKRVGIDAIIQQDLNCIQCSASNLNGLIQKMDPLHDIRAAEWGYTYPGSMLDLQFGRWRDEGQNAKNVDETTLEKVYKQPMIFEKDPFDSEEEYIPESAAQTSAP